MLYSPAAPLALCLFGPFSARVSGLPLPRLRSRLGEWLLALLVLRAGQPVERSWLAGTLWPESSERQALTNLRVSLKDLRRALGPEATRLRSPSPHTLVLELDGADVDLLQFDAALACGDEPALSDAVALYRGPLLEGCVEPWAFEARQGREQAYLGALEQLAAWSRERGEFAKAESYLRRAVAVDPLREEAQRALMQALAAAGSFGAATEVYRELRDVLHREVNGAPAAETRAVYDGIRTQARRRAAGVRASAPPREEGRAATRRSDTSSGDTPLHPHNLPLQLSSFVGREAQIVELKQWLAGPSRLLTLTGGGGCGKTRLALQVAAELLHEYADGVRLVELASLADAALVSQAVATAVGVRESTGSSITEALMVSLKQRQLLMVLDNCEHLLGSCAELATALLQACPRLQILATSREVLGVAGEIPYRVPPLSVPSLPAFKRSGVQVSGTASPEDRSARTPEHLVQFEAVRLFLERAVTAPDRFTLTGENAPWVVQICQQLDGMPLAIELAAARVRALPVEQIARRLDDRFRLLKGSRTALPRHQTLKALIDWSYDLLSKPERVLLRRLSVFAGGWTLEAAEAVCAGEEVWEMVDLLGGLVDKSLVGYEERGAARYRLLETVRQYARVRLLEAGEAEAVRARHCDWFLALAEEAELEIHSGAEQRACAEQRVWLERLEREHDNLREALAWSGAPGQGVAGLRLGGALGEFWLVRGYLGEGRERLAELLALPGMEGRTAARAKVLNIAGRLAHGQGNCAAARALFEERLAISRELGDNEGIAGSLARLGSLAHAQGDYAAARLPFEEGLAICRELGDKWRTAWSLYGLGRAAHAQGDYVAARTLLEEGLAIGRELGHKHLIARLLGNLGAVAHAQGEYGAARALLAEGEAIARSIEDQRARILPLGEMGHLARDLGDYGRAAALYRESLALRREFNDPLETARSLEDFAVLAARQGQAKRVARLLGAAATQCDAIGASPPVAMAAEYERSLAAVRSALGEESFAAAWAEGQAMSLEEALRYALESN